MKEQTGKHENSEEFASLQLDDPYTVPYEGIYVICNEKNDVAEIIEQTNCFGGACWSLCHYSKAPIVTDTKTYGDFIRYTVSIGKKPFELKSSVAAAGIESVILESGKNEIQITYIGLGGGGVGATRCRAFAKGVNRYEITDSGGGKVAKGTIYVPRRKRVLVAIDDTDSKETGATWTLTHNIARAVETENAVYLSHSLVQLYPVPEKTQNCMSTVLEFGVTGEKEKEELIEKIKFLLLKYSVSNSTGLLVYTGFDVPEPLKEYSQQCRTTRLTKETALKTARENNVDIVLDGNGIIGALGAFAWFSNPRESVKPGFNPETV